MSDSAQIELQIITPEGAMLRTNVDELTAPSVNGDFGVLAGHRPLIAALRTGIVTYRKGSEHEQVAVGPGFVEIANDRALLLTRSCCRASEVDLSSVRQELSEADEALLSFGGVLRGTGTWGIDNPGALGGDTVGVVWRVPTADDSHCTRVPNVSTWQLSGRTQVRRMNNSHIDLKLGRLLSECP